jgi:hypothetical protein
VEVARAHVQGRVVAVHGVAGDGRAGRHHARASTCSWVGEHTSIISLYNGTWDSHENNYTTKDMPSCRAIWTHAPVTSAFILRTQRPGYTGSPHTTQPRCVVAALPAILTCRSAQV